MRSTIAGIAAIACLLAGCGGGASSSRTVPVSRAVSDTGVLQPDDGGALGPRGRIKHVVIVVQENRTFDDLFLGFPGADTQAYGFDHNRNRVDLRPTPFELPPDPSHERKALLTEYDGGKMDGFDLDPISLTVAGPTASPPPPDFTYAYVPQAETVPYWELARRYAVADRMFSSQMAPSFAGHLYLIGAQSARVIDNPAGPDPRVNAVWGCDSPAGSTVHKLDASGNVVDGGFPCLDFPTLGDLLDQKSVSWKYYSGAVDGLDLDGQVSAYDAIRHIRYGPDWTRSVPQMHSGEFLFFDDVAANALPAVSWLTPPALASDHAGTLNSTGPSWVAAVVNAIANSPYANDTAILITWDDSGGWYDHVPPPSFDGLSYGFRVPLLIVSPYTRHGYISHITHDFGSIHHFVERTYDLSSLHQLDATADDLSDTFDFSKPPTPIAPIAAPFSLAELRLLRSTRPVDDDN